MKHPLGVAVTHFVIKEYSHNAHLFFWLTRGVASAPKFQVLTKLVLFT